MVEQERTKRTYFYELWRAVGAGVIETAGTTFLLLIAVKAFEAGAVAKGLVAAGGSLGLLASPLVVTWVSGRDWPAAQGAARILAVGAASFVGAALLPGLGSYVVCTVLGMASSAAIIPLLTQMYQENYPVKERGRFYSGTVMIRIAVAAVFSHVAGQALEGQMESFPVLLLIFAGALGLASFCLGRCPTQPLPSDSEAHPLRLMRFLREDALFRRVLLSWMIMGFANLMMLPLRVEYLANPKYGLSFSVGMIALLTSVVPNVSRLVLSPLWGYLFDRMDFVALRLVLNLGFVVGTLLFFLSDSVGGLLWGAIVYGVSNAGGEVAWGLWVIKFAPAQRVADYMSVHTCLTGVRGVVAPLVAFFFSARLTSLDGLALSGAGLIVLATVLLVPEVRLANRNRPSGGRGTGTAG